MKRIVINIIAWLNKLGWILVLIAVIFVYIDNKNKQQKLEDIGLRINYIESSLGRPGFRSISREGTITAKLDDLESQIEDINDKLDDISSHFNF